MNPTFPIPRRSLMIASVGLASLAARPAAADPRVLVIANDIGDTITLDPARMATYTPALSVHTAYDTLVTMDPGDYVTIRPMLAESFGRTPDGAGWRFRLRRGVKFASGNPLTAADVVFSLNRMLHIGDQPAGYFRTVAGDVAKVDDMTVDIRTTDPNDPLLTILCAPGGSILDAKVVRAHGGTDAADAKDTDKATQFLNTSSAGSGPYSIASWERSSAIVLQRNPNYWHGTPGYERVIIRHIAESGAQLLALRRGDVDVAFNLTPEQVKSVEADHNIRIARAVSQDWTYIALTNNSEISPALTRREARLAVANAIDYDGIRDSLVDGQATRPASYISIGIGGSTEQLTKEIGYHQDLARSKQLLAQAGFPDGFSFPLYYQAGSFAGVPYHLMAQKVQADLARVGIKADLKPMDPVTLRTMFISGKAAAAFGYWNPPALEPLLNAEAIFKRGATRVGWKIDPAIGEIAVSASRATTRQEQDALYRKFTEAVQAEGHFLVLFQPFYQVAVRRNVDGFTLTAAGWFAELAGAKPTS